MGGQQSTVRQPIRQPIRRELSPQEKETAFLKAAGNYLADGVYLYNMVTLDGERRLILRGSSVGDPAGATADLARFRNIFCQVGKTEARVKRLQQLIAILGVVILFLLVRQNA